MMLWETLVMVICSIFDGIFIGWMWCEGHYHVWSNIKKGENNGNI
jgi:hypothetical protein